MIDETELPPNLISKLAEGQDVPIYADLSHFWVHCITSGMLEAVSAKADGEVWVRPTVLGISFFRSLDTLFIAMMETALEALNESLATPNTVSPNLEMPQ